MLGRFSSILVHEAGHFAPGYLFNPGAIEGMYFYPWRLLTPGSLNLEVVAEVKFKGDLPQLYSSLEAGMVLMGGLVFQFILLLGAVALLNRYSGGKRGFKLFSLGLGFYLGLSNILYSWWQDAVEMSLVNDAPAGYVFALVAGAMATFYLWFLARYVRLVLRLPILIRS